MIITGLNRTLQETVRLLPTQLSQHIRVRRPLGPRACAEHLAQTSGPKGKWARE